MPATARRSSACTPSIRRTNLEPMNKARWLGSAAAAVLALASLAGARAEGSGYPGITEPAVDVALGLPGAGIVTVRQHKEGDFVRAGDVIFELDERLEELELDRRRFL